jgi:hypothetical protein
MHQEAAAGTHAGDKTVTPAQEFLFGFGRHKQEIYVLPVIVPGHEKAAEPGVMRQGIVHGGCADDGTQHRMGPHVPDPLTQAINDPAVIQAL